METAISIFGLGYVGCVSAACLASSGFNIVGVDLNEEKVAMINAGKSPIVEPGLEGLVDIAVTQRKLRATTSCQDAVENSDLAFICVGTPGNQHGQLQLDALAKVGLEIGRALRGTQRKFTVVVRSTVLPGTTKEVVLTALLEGAGKEFKPWLRLAVNPEFIREGTALLDFGHPPFTLVGCEEDETATLLKTIYSSVDAPFIQTQVSTAETVKYVSNAYHALKVCFANEIGDVCTALGTDAQEVMRIFRLDEKLNISPAYLKPGFAFGGSCLPKDIRALLYAAHHADVSLPLLDAILPSNQAQLQQGIDRIVETGKKRVGIVGLSFKPDTDDLRESPMVTLVEALVGKGFKLRIFDRNVAIAKLTGANRRYIVEEIPHISTLMCDNIEALMAHSDVLVIGSNDSDGIKVLQLAGPQHQIIDLTRGVLKLNTSSRLAA